jgi:hypothetical protein
VVIRFALHDGCTIFSRDRISLFVGSPVSDRNFQVILQKVKDDTTTLINKRFLPGHPMHRLDPHFFLNLDQTAVYFENKSKTVVAKKGSKTVSTRDSGSNKERYNKLGNKFI